MRLYKQRGYWYVDLRVRGNRRRRISLGTKNRTFAEKRASALAATNSGNITHQPIEQLIAEYRRYCDRTQTAKTVRGNKARWELINRYVQGAGLHRLDRLNKVEISKFTNHLWDRNLSNATVNRYISLIKSFLRWASDNGYLVEMPQLSVRKLPEQRGVHRRVFSPSDLRSLCGAAGTTEFGLFIELLSLTGCRCDELRLIRCRNVDLDRRELRLENTKTHEARTVPLTDRAYAICKELISKQPTFFLFGGRKPYWTQNSAIQAMARLSRKTGIKGSLHDLRSTFVSMLLDRGVGLKTIQELIGDKTARMVMEVYAQTVSGSAREAVNRLSR